MEGACFFFRDYDEEDEGLFFCVGECQKSDNNSTEADRNGETFTS